MATFVTWRDGDQSSRRCHPINLWEPVVSTFLTLRKEEKQVDSSKRAEMD